MHLVRVMAVMRAVADISQVALRPSWRSCARSLARHKLRCDRHRGHAHDRLCIASRAAPIMTVMCAIAGASQVCAATVMAVMRAIAYALRVALQPSLRACARSLARRKLRCDRHGGRTRDR